MSVERDGFEALVAGAFSDAEIRNLDRLATLGQYALEPVWPSVPEITTILDSVLEDILHMPVPEDDPDLWHQAHVELARRLIPLLTIRSDDEVVVEGACSFISPGGLWVLDGKARMFGNFFAMTVDTWVDVPFDEEACGHPDAYPMSEGLHLVMEDTRLAYKDGDTEILGQTQVALNHGNPRLYRILRQEAL